MSTQYIFDLLARCQERCQDWPDLLPHVEYMTKQTQDVTGKIRRITEAEDEDAHIQTRLSVFYGCLSSLAEASNNEDARKRLAKAQKSLALMSRQADNNHSSYI
jgi:hypothetical protein